MAPFRSPRGLAPGECPTDITFAVALLLLIIAIFSARAAHHKHGADHLAGERGCDGTEPHHAEGVPAAPGAASGATRAAASTTKIEALLRPYCSDRR